MNPKTPASRHWIHVGIAFVAGMATLAALPRTPIAPVAVALVLLALLLARRAADQWARSKQGHVQLTRVLMAAVDAADPFTRGHSYRVSRMCLSLGRHLKLRPAALEELEFAALLHDLGRTAIQRDILVKRGKLTEQEMQLLQAHPRIGAELLGDERFFPGAAAIIHAHHEQPDGGGYPQGLAGDAVPAGSRIIMVVAAFDAMTSDRPYRRGLSPEEAFEELLAHAGTQFFPDVVEALIQLYADGRLFADFDEEHLERYRAGQEHSRAVEAHLRRHETHAGVPPKAGVGGAKDRARSAELPVIELPVLELPVAAVPVERLEQTIALDRKGRLRLEVAGQTDLGCGRKNNEDSFGAFAFDDPARGGLLVLADGMGGAAAGEVASRLALDTVRDAYAGWRKRGPVREALAHAIGAANQAVHAHAAGDARLAGMGTTCTTAAIVGTELTLGHVGDSRAYLVRGGAIEQVTLDHTLAGEMIRAAGGDAAVAAGIPSNVLTRSIGAQAEVQADVSAKPIALAPGTAIVLCSDGLSNEVEPAEILEIVAGHTPAAACEALVELARARGGADNITVLVGRVQKG